jgi:hypothetical protein
MPTLEEIRQQHLLLSRRLHYAAFTGEEVTAADRQRAQDLSRLLVERTAPDYSAMVASAVSRQTKAMAHS